MAADSSADMQIRRIQCLASKALKTNKVIEDFVAKRNLSIHKPSGDIATSSSSHLSMLDTADPIRNAGRMNGYHDKPWH